MVVLLTGATGFIGRHILDALLARGHTVVCALRRPHCLPSASPRVRAIYADFGADFDPAVWVPRLDGVEVVINAVGILRERGGARFEAVHVKAPGALFSACATAGVRRVIQISALGADEGARSGYHLSKKAADDFLTTLPVSWIVVQPSLVYGPGGTSARLFTAIASLPLIPVPGRGDQLVQPVHIDDVTAAVLSLLESETFVRRRVPLAGPEPVTLRDFLTRLRAALGLGAAHIVGIPMGWVHLAARLGRAMPSSLLDAESLGMLLRGNTADPGPTRELLGREPRSVEAFVPARDARAVRALGKLQWLLPVLRWSIAVMWIVTGIVSLGVYPVQESYALLARVGAAGVVASVLLYGAALLDIALGVATLVMRRRRLLWLVQIGLILGYTLVITVRLPEFWLHPYGPVLKNLPLLAAIWLAYELEEP